MKTINPKDLLTHKRFDIAIKYLETHYKLTLDDIVNNPRYHLYYNGFKYVTLDVIKNMKKLRNEPKDRIDVKLIESLK
jgi:hypothetical protein